MSKAWFNSRRLHHKLLRLRIYGTMSTWNRLREAVESMFMSEASDPVETMMRYVVRRYGENEEDEIRSQLAKIKDPERFMSYLDFHYGDKELNRLASALLPKGDGSKKAGQAKAQREPMQAGDSPSRDKGVTGADAPIPARPDRAGVTVRQGPQLDRDTDTKSPKFQAMGTAGQNPAQPQPSIVGGDRSFKTRTGDRKVGTVPNPMPKAPETNQLDKLHALLKNDSELTRIARKKMSKPDGSPIQGMELGPTKQKLISAIKAKIASLGQLGKSTIQTKTGLEPDKFFRQGASVKDVEHQGDSTWDPKTKSFIKGTGQEPKVEPARTGGTVKPDHDGTFIGQRWSPNAYTTNFGDFTGQGDDKKFVKDPLTKGGLGFKGGQYGNAATGQMSPTMRAPNPAKPGQEWRSEHDLIWAGKDLGGWLSKSQFAALVATGKIKKKDRDPSKPDLSKGRVVSPVNPPSSRANLDNTTGRPKKDGGE